MRGGVQPHVPPPASPVSTPVRLELEVESERYPEVVLVDPRREHEWRVAMERVASREHHVLRPEAASESGDIPQSAIRNPQSEVWQAEILLPQEPTRLHYHFELAGGKVIREKRQVEGMARPLFGVWEEQEFHIAVYDPKGAPPDWVPGSIFYQIFPDRFAVGNPENVRKGGKVYDKEPLYVEWDEMPEHKPKSRDFYGGDLQGVTGKLDYLKELGITCIYFTPIFESPSNHRYDAIDYVKIDPRLGTEEDLKELIDKGHEQGLRVLLDGVFNHCSSESVYFKGAREDKLSPYYRWFSFLEWPDKWEGWLGVNTMPELVECPEVEQFFFGPEGVAQYWLSLGTAGWRTDVTPWITDEYWRRFRRAVRFAFPQAYLVSEDWGDATHRLLGDTYDATMNYRFGYSVAGFAGGKLTPAELDDRLETLRRDTPLPSFHVQMNLLDSHDTPRVYTVLGKDKARMKLAVAMQFAYPGVPTVFSGDEAGVEGEYAENSRRPFPWGKEDRELLEFYKKVMHTRKASAALSLGGVETVYIDDAGGYGFLRRYEKEAVLALFNNGADELKMTIPLAEGAPSGEWLDLLGGEAATVSGDVLTAVVPSMGAAWYRATSGEPLRE